jgi:hypothetical protein
MMLKIPVHWLNRKSQAQPYGHQGSDPGNFAQQAAQSCCSVVHTASPSGKETHLAAPLNYRPLPF